MLPNSTAASPNPATIAAPMNHGFAFSALTFALTSRVGLRAVECAPVVERVLGCLSNRRAVAAVPATGHTFGRTLLAEKKVGYPFPLVARGALLVGLDTHDVIVRNTSGRSNVGPLGERLRGFKTPSSCFTN